jgi:putative membrane protein insertion efficiency factor
MKHVMIALVKLYRKYISPAKPPCCRFTPTCSAYALEAFTKRGFFVGLVLTVWRILRCNPFSKGGYDPVPEKGFRNKFDSRFTGDSHKACEHTDTKENEKD